MPDVSDGYTTMMREHLAGCYQARGLSPAGAVQAANQQAPSSPFDQAMLAEQKGFEPHGTVYAPTLNEQPTGMVGGPTTAGDQAMFAALEKTSKL